MRFIALLLVFGILASGCIGEYAAATPDSGEPPDAGDAGTDGGTMPTTITSVAVSPTTLSLNVATQRQLSATVTGTGTYSSAVAWSAQRGTIDSSGLYTAPSTAGADVVIATSMQDTSKTASTSITVTSTIPSGTSVKTCGAQGDGVTDDTASIQACINAVAGTGGTVIVPAGTFMINPLAASGSYGLTLGSDMTLYLASGAVLQAITNSAPNYAIVGMIGVNNTTVTGPGTISGDRATHTGTSGEWGMGIYVGNNVATNCTISNITVRDCWGDGIYVYETSSNTNLTIDNVVSDNNRRQGLSIIVVNGITVTNSTFKNTNGTGPECGIDIEPNAGESATRVSINHCVLTGNRGGGFQLGGGVTTTVINVIFDANSVTNNGLGVRGPNDSATPFGVLISQCLGNSSLATAPKITNNIITGNLGSGIAVTTQWYSTITGNTISDTAAFAGDQYSGAGVSLWNANAVQITNNTLSNNATWGVWDLGVDTGQADPANPGQNHAVSPVNVASPNTYSGNGSGTYKNGI